MNWSETLVNYYENLETPELPEGVECMNPYREAEVKAIVRTYFQRYYGDSNKRTLLFGINPGRFGAGVTGISFTDPVILKERLGISHGLELRPELSAGFIHDMIDAFGGIEDFTAHFLITSVYPLGFLEDGKNINYYEIPGWRDALLPHIRSELKAHGGWNINRDVAICIGQGQNLKFFTELNKELGLFKRILTLPHPRWVMQYRTKLKGEFINEYVKTLGAFVG